MLAQLFLTPVGMMLEVASAAALAVELADSPQPTSAGLEVSQLSSPALGASHDSPVAGASQAVDSGVGIEVSAVSLLRPFVCATEAPRALPPLPRSVPRPRPPLPPSKPARPPREVLVWLVASPKEVTVASLAALERERSFFAFETSPHCEIVPVVTSQQSFFFSKPVAYWFTIISCWLNAYHQLSDQPQSPDHHRSPEGRIQHPRQSSRGTFP